jgi:hypothetical protein
VAELYRSGLSLAVLGENVGVNPTIREDCIRESWGGHEGQPYGLGLGGETLASGRTLSPGSRRETVPMQSRRCSTR